MKKLVIEKLNNQNWITVEDAANLLYVKPKTLKERCRKGEYNYRVVQENKKFIYMIHKESLPINIQEEQSHVVYTSNINYSDAPNWAKMQADKYIQILKGSADLKGKKLEEYIKIWNENNPELKTSYCSILRMRRRYKKYGIKGLLAQYGKSTNKIVINNNIFNYFKKIYLDQGAPSIYSCWKNTYGYAVRHYNVELSDFPSYVTFIRRLRSEMPEQAIYLARYGKTAFNKKYGNYLQRDYSTVECGKVWVSDHAQIDVAVFDSDGNVVFPWVTAWRDYKSSKWLGWTIQCGSPNSDRIFQAFYYAATTYGLPDDVIIDNGKDYRSRDFAGGRNRENFDNKGKATSMLDELGVQVHFALPYNAQTKPIERDFRTIKEYLSKHCQGYRGGNVVERPEILKDDIKSKYIMDFEKFKDLFNDFIINVFNKKESAGMNLNGLCPDELFNMEFKEKRVSTRDALKLFCMRTSNNYTIYRNGIQDKQNGITYWADWMVAQMKERVYLRRDPENYKEAWIFRADNDEFLGKAVAVRAVAALHAGEIAKEEFQTAMSIKKRSIKLTKAYIDQLDRVPFEEQLENYKAAYSKKIKEANPKITKLANTKMDEAIRKNKDMESKGKYDMSMFNSDDKPKKKFYYYETEKYLDEDEELMEVAYGY